MMMPRLTFRVTHLLTWLFEIHLLAINNGLSLALFKISSISCCVLLSFALWANHKIDWLVINMIVIVFDWVLFLIVSSRLVILLFFVFYCIITALLNFSFFSFNDRLVIPFLVTQIDFSLTGLRTLFHAVFGSIVVWLVGNGFPFSMLIILTFVFLATIHKTWRALECGLAQFFPFAIARICGGSSILS